GPWHAAEAGNWIGHKDLLTSESPATAESCPWLLQLLKRSVRTPALRPAGRSSPRPGLSPGRPHNLYCRHPDAQVHSAVLTVFDQSQPVTPAPLRLIPRARPPAPTSSSPEKPGGVARGKPPTASGKARYLAHSVSSARLPCCWSRSAPAAVLPSSP